MSPMIEVLHVALNRAPRVSGDEPGLPVGRVLHDWCSPRERG